MARRVVFFSTLALVAAGCGSSSPTSSPTAAAPPLVITTAAAPIVTAPVPTTLGPPKQPFKIALTSDGHSPTVGRPWHFTVRVTDLHGRPLPGTVKPHVVLSGQVIDTIGWFGFSNGIFKHEIVWTADKQGQPLVFRVEVDANGGAKNVDYPILVK